MTRNQAVEEFVSDLREGPRPAVLDGFEDLSDYIAENLQELNGYSEVEILHRPDSMVETYRGPVMGGPPEDSSRRYSVESDGPEAVFEMEVEDSSISMNSTGDRMVIEDGDYRKLSFDQESGDREIYRDMVREVENLIGPDGVEYQPGEAGAVFEFERDMPDL